MIHVHGCISASSRFVHLRTLDRAQMHKILCERGNILVDPLKLHDKTESAAFDFMSEVKNVYLKQITSVDV